MDNTQQCLTWPHRILSPPLSSPRQLPPQPPLSPVLHPPGDLLEPSQPQAQPPTQSPHHFPVSQPHSVRATVDRGCDPIVFSDDSESDNEDGEAGGEAAEKLSMGRARQVARYSIDRLDQNLPSCLCRVFSNLWCCHPNKSDILKVMATRLKCVKFGCPLHNTCITLSVQLVHDLHAPNACYVTKAKQV